MAAVARARAAGPATGARGGAAARRRRGAPRLGRGLRAIDGEEIQGDMSRRSPNDVDESDPEERAMLDAENDMLAADLDFLESTGALAEGAQQEEPDDVWYNVKQAIDTFLLYDFGVICVILLWLVVGVAKRVALDGGLEVDEPVVGLWLTLWPVIFLPLLSIHMGATLLSPALSWAKRNGYLGENTWA